MELEKIKYICKEKSNEGMYDYKMEVPRDFWCEVLQIIENLEAENDNKKMSIESDGFIIDYGNGCKFKSSKDGSYITRDNGEHWTNLETWFFTREWNE